MLFIVIALVIALAVLILKATKDDELTHEVRAIFRNIFSKAFVTDAKEDFKHAAATYAKAFGQLWRATKLVSLYVLLPLILTVLVVLSISDRTISAFRK